MAGRVLFLFSEIFWLLATSLCKCRYGPFIQGIRHGLSFQFFSLLCAVDYIMYIVHILQITQGFKRSCLLPYYIILLLFLICYVSQPLLLPNPPFSFYVTYSWSLLQMPCFSLAKCLNVTTLCFINLCPHFHGLISYYLHSVIVWSCF